MFGDPWWAVANMFGPKVILVLAIDINGIFHYELLGKNETVN